MRGGTVRVRVATDDDDDTSTTRVRATVRGERRVGRGGSVGDARVTVRGPRGAAPQREHSCEEEWVDRVWADPEVRVAGGEEVWVDGGEEVWIDGGEEVWVDGEQVEPVELSTRPPMRAHVGFELGGVTLGALRAAADVRLQFPRGLDVDVGYAGYFDTQNEDALGLGRMGLSYRAVDLDYFQVRVGAKVHRLRDAAGVVTGAEWLSLGATLEHGHISVMGDVGWGMIGRAFLVTSRATLGILLGRGLELTIGVDYANFIPIEAPSEAVPLLSVNGGARVLF